MANLILMMKYIFAISALMSLMACGGLDFQQDRLINDLQDVIDRADQRLENPTTSADWEPIEKEYQSIAKEVREEYPEYEPPIQLRFDSLMNYYKAQRQAYLELNFQRQQQEQQQPENPEGDNSNSADAASNES